MSARDVGPSAFPVPASDSNGRQVQWPETGMSLRDYFAAKAMAAIISKAPFQVGTDAPRSVELQASTVKCTALGAYYYADAMLAERAK